MSNNIIEHLETRLTSSIKKVLNINILIILVILLSFQSCKSPTAPKIYNTPPGSRNYTWVMDTLKIPDGTGIYPSRIWGSSAQDVWAVGDAYLNELCIWHFDGTSWKTTPANQYIDPRGIFGFGKNDVWIASTDGAFWHYTGTTWSKFCETKIDSFDAFMPQSMSGRAPNEIYTVGCVMNNDGTNYKGIIMQYDGNKWSQMNIPYIRASFTQIFFNVETSEYLINGLVFENSKNPIYIFNGKEIKEIQSPTEFGSLNMIGDNIYFVGDYKIFKYENSKFNLFKDFTGTDYAGRAWGRNEKDFFTINWGGIGHYNGNDLITIVPKANSDWAPNESIIFEKDFFSIWQDTRTAYTIAIHGILKN
jgi:hypothetical protein